MSGISKTLLTEFTSTPCSNSITSATTERGHLIVNAASSDTALPKWRIFLLAVLDRSYVLHFIFKSIKGNFVCDRHTLRLTLLVVDGRFGLETLSGSCQLFYANVTILPGLNWLQQGPGLSLRRSFCCWNSTQILGKIILKFFTFSKPILTISKHNSEEAINNILNRGEEIKLLTK